MNGTTLRIAIVIYPEFDISAALAGLPQYCIETFKDHGSGYWTGEFPVSCSVAPYLAEGDFVDDLAPYFPHLLRLQKFQEATFELEIAVGSPGPDTFRLPPNLVALLAALGASIVAKAVHPAIGKQVITGDI